MVHGGKHISRIKINGFSFIYFLTAIKYSIRKLADALDYFCSGF